jgi:hypothetical protein
MPLLVVSLYISDIHAELHRYIIKSPYAQPSLPEPITRLTHTSVAYDTQRKKRVFIKDSWRIVAADVPVEGQVA